MKIVSWNVAGLRSLLGIGTGKDKTDNFLDLMKLEPDIVCFQESKIQLKYIKDVENRLSELGFTNYDFYSNHCTAFKGRHGVAFLIKDTVHFNKIVSGFGVEHFDCEGRCITLHTDDFVLINTYVPQSGTRVKYRMEWEAVMRSYIAIHKDVIWCGDLNVAHEEIDVHDHTKVKGKAGFRDSERFAINSHLDNFYDSFREKCKDKCFTYWDYRTKGREINRGWRIDYFLIAKTLNVDYEAVIHDDIYGSDHCPVSINMK